MDDTGRINFKHRLPQLTPEFLDWLQKMVEPNFKHRYASADAALNDLISLEVVRQPKKSKLALISIGVLTASAAIFIPFILKSPKPQQVANSQPETTKPNLKPVTKVMLTRELKSEKIIDFVSLKKPQKVYFAVSVTNLSKGEYQGICKLFDPEGKLVAQGQSRLMTTADRLKTWCGYNFTNYERLGNWKFEFYLDNQKMAAYIV